MSTDETSQFVDSAMPGDAPLSHPAAQLPVAQFCDDFRTSHYSTGILTTAGWRPIDNIAWRVVRNNADSRANKTTEYADVEELLQCHEEESVRHLREAKALPHVSDNVLENATIIVPAEDPTQASTDAHLDYTSYFRHAGWTGCASLDQHTTDSSEALNTLVKVKQADCPSSAPVSATTTSLPSIQNLPEKHSQQHRTEDPAHGAPTEEGGEQSIIAKGLPMLAERVKPVKAFFHPEEDAWLLLFHRKIKGAAEAGQNIKLPGPHAVLTVFNEFFVGRVLKDEHGVELPLRRAREEKSMKAKIMKMHSKIWQLRNVTRRLIEGKRGGVVCVPEITEEELRQYRDDGTVLL